MRSFLVVATVVVSGVSSACSASPRAPTQPNVTEPTATSSTKPASVPSAAPAASAASAPAATVVEIAAGERHACARRSDGAVYCWGDNEYGQVGDPTSLDAHPRPLRVGELPPASHVAAGGDVTCAVTNDGRLFCWGEAAYHMLGRVITDCKTASGTTRSQYAECSPRPVEIPLANVTQVVVGRHHVCAAMHGGSVSCWGGNEYGQIGSGKKDERPPPTPVKLAGSGEVIQLFGLVHETCARRASGDVTCWGANGFAQACRTTTPLPPTTVDGFRGADELGGSPRILCGRKGGTVTCCGGQSWTTVVEKKGRETITSAKETTRWPTPTVVPQLAGADRLTSTGDAVCGHDKSGWTCVPDVLHTDDAEANARYASFAPPDVAAHVVATAGRLYLRDDGVVLVSRGGKLTPLEW